MLKILAAIFIFITFPLLGSEVEVSSFVNRATITTGDLLTFKVEVKSDPTVEVSVPEIGAQIKGFRVVDFGKIDETVVDGVKTVGKYYELQADLVGSYILPSVQVNYDGKEYKTSEIFVEVKSVLKSAKGGKDKDIRDIKTIIPSDKRINRYVLIGTGAVLLILALLGYFWWRQRTSKEDIKVIIPPDVVALTALTELEQLDLLAKKEDKRFHFSLSEITRSYIEGRFKFRATDMTTEEIKRSISKLLDLSSENRVSFLELLDKTDIVKFTDICLEESESLSLMKRSRELINSTKRYNEDYDEDGSVV